jgi:3-hydroxyanthranilate 3,4-dioxygenase
VITSTSIRPPFNLQAWVDEHRDLLKPPVGNHVIYRDSEILVRIVGGPNSRRDFHINPTEELYYQIEGGINLRVINDGRVEEVRLRQGDLFLLPANVPHCPQRPAKSVGLVMERQRRPGEIDHLCFYCEGCGNVLHQRACDTTDMSGGQLKAIMDEFWLNKSLRTCAQCGRIASPPPPPGLVA